MCSICHASPCLARCPNAEEAAVVHHCVCCHGDICEGDDYYEIYDRILCAGCVEECRLTAESEEYDYDEEEDEDF